MTLATGSLGKPGDPTHAGILYSGIEIAAVDYSPALQLTDPLAAPVPYQPSYEDRPAGPTGSSPPSTKPPARGWWRPGPRRSPAPAPVKPICSTCTT